MFNAQAVRNLQIGRKTKPNQVAYVIIDSKSKDLFMPTVFSATVSESLDDMAQQLGLLPR